MGDKMNSNSESTFFNRVLDMLSKTHSDYLLINRIIYKVKNQFRRQNQYKYLQLIRKKLKTDIFNQLETVIKLDFRVDALSQSN
jgi:hypothetical protein